MPYSSIKDAPPSLVGAGLSLAQINVWSKIFDSAKAGGVDEPAAVAWSQFKKMYKKVGEKWVKKLEKLEQLSVPLMKLSKWPKSWEVPEEVVVIRSSNKNLEIEIPYIVKDRLILKEGTANGIYYSGEELEPCVAVLNEKPDPEDVEARKQTSLFWDHDDECKNWLGEVKNFRWDEEQRAIIGDLYFVDKVAAEKTHYQLEISEDKLSRWGISPRVKINEQDGRATDISFVSQAIVLDPAGGPKLMLEKDKTLDDMYEDLSLELDGNNGNMEFEQAKQDMKLLAKEFDLTEEEIAEFGKEQLALLCSISNAKDILDEEENENSEDEKVVCSGCGAKISPGIDECPECGAEIKEEDEEAESIQKYLESFAPILKIDNDEHVVKMVVLEPEVVDNHGHIVSELEIQNAMYLWMEKYKNTEIMHRDRGGNLFPMEQSIISPDDNVWKYGWNKEMAILECYQAPMDYFEGEELVRKGSWVLTLRVNDNNIWQKIKSKELTGASMGGHAALRTEVAE